MNKLTIQELCGMIGTLLFMASVTLVSGDYLPLIGPPPLRFATIQLPGETQTNLRSVAKPNFDSTALAVRNSGASTNTSMPKVSAGSTHASSATTGTGEQEEAALEYRARVVTSDPSISQGDLPTVSPGMIVDYFQPIGNGRNGADTGISIPLRLEFTPPILPTTVQNHASYKSQ